MKTVLHITQCLSGGGAGRELVYLARYSMDSSEFQHKIVTLSPSTPGGIKLTEDYSVSVIETPSRERLENEIENADITQVSWWNNPEITGFLHSYIPDTRLIIRYHVAGHTAPQCIVKEHLDMADLNVISYKQLPILKQYEESWKKERVDWILHGTDLMRLDDRKHKSHQTFNVGYIGTVSFVKMHPDYVKMSNEIDVPDIKFIVCGNIEEESILRQVNKFDAHAKFDFKGYVEDIRNVISEMDVFGYPLCPDTYASTDLVLQEVMYAGVPAVVFNYGGLAQTVKDGENGIIVNSAKEYKEAIEYLYNNPAERKRLGESAKSFIEENLGIKNTVKKYHSVYDRLLQKTKTWHEWGKDSHKPLLEQPISYQDITGEPPKRKTADIFIASLGPYGRCFAKSKDINLPNSKLFEADEEIANVSDITYRIGLLWYQGYDPTDAYLNFWAGLVLKSRQHTMQAIECWAKAHEHGFDHWRLYWYMAVSLKECNKEAEAHKVYQYLSRIKPDWEEIIKPFDLSKDTVNMPEIDKPSAETIYGDILSSLKGNKSEAKIISKLENFLKSYPDYALAHNDLAVLSYNQGEKERAYYHYQQAVQLDPENITFQKNLADYYYVELGQVENALKIYVKIFSANPEDIEILLILGQICIALEKFDDAKSFYNRVLSIEPQNPYAKECLEKMEKHQLSIVSGQSDQTKTESNSKGILVSAIVSTYNAERFIRGRLEDLERQTIAGNLEIVVVNSGSQQNEETIIKEFQEKYSNIKYIKTNQRETVYAAWNRGIKASRGKYITNANTDDRLRQDALEVMVNTLEAHPEIALVYADVIITETENESFETCTPVGLFNWLDFNRHHLLNQGCFVGPQPMWRREVHDEYGYFDASFITSGDYEFWLRISQTNTFKHLPVRLGMYLRSPGSIEHSNRDKQWQENQKIIQMYQKAQASGKIIGRIQASSSPGHPETKSENINSPESIYQNIQAGLESKQPQAVISELEALTASYPDFALAHNDLGVLHYHTANKEKAHQFYEKAVQLDPENMVFQKNLADFYCIEKGWVEKALQIYVKILEHNPQDIETLLITGNICVALNNFEDAEVFYRRVLELEPQNQDAQNNLDKLDKMGAIAPELKSPEEWYQDILPLLNSGDPQRAISELENLLQTYPDFALAQNDLGVLYYHTGDKEKSRHHYGRAVELMPGNINFQKNLADFLFVEDAKVEEALQIYVNILATHPDDVETLLIAGHICAALKKFDDAKDFYERVLALAPDNEDAAKNLQALNSRQIGEPPASAASFKEVTVSSLKIESADISSEEPENQDADRKTTASIVISLDGIQNRVKECVKSIQAHTVDPFELLLIDCGATKGMFKWAQQLAKDNDYCHIIESASQMGQAEKLNQAIQKAGGDIIVLMHNDVAVPQGWLEALKMCFKLEPNIGVAGPMSNRAAGIQQLMNSDEFERIEFESDAAAFREQNQYRRVATRKLAGFCLAFRRDLPDAIGYFDEQFVSEEMIVEDFCNRAAARGYRNLVAADTYVFHYDRHKAKKNASPENSASGEDRKKFNEKWNDSQNPEVKALQTVLFLSRATELSEKSQIDPAVELLLNAIGIQPEEKRLYLGLAEILLAAKRFQDVRDVLPEMPAENGSPEINKVLLLGYAEEGLGNYDAAKACAEQVLTIDPTHARVLNLEGILAYRNNDCNSAEKYFKRSIASDPGYGEPYTNLAMLKMEAEEAEEALAYFEKAFILSPTDLDIATNYHAFIQGLGDFKRAENVARQAADLHPNNQKIKYMLIDVLVQQGNYETAMPEIEDAIVKFGIDDGILAAALKIREKLGPMTIKPSSKKVPVSVCMIIKDEEKYLARCLASVKPIVDEMIVVDTGSTDRSRDIAITLGAKVYDYVWENDFAAARNFSISRASGEWIFIMDGDEVISPLDYEHFNKIITKKPKAPVAYSITTRNYSKVPNVVGWVPNDGKYPDEEKTLGWLPSDKVRLFYGKDQVLFEGAVHEMVDPVLKRKGIEIKKCRIPVHHYGRLDQEKLSRKGETYFDIGQKKLSELGEDVRALWELAIQATILEKNKQALELWQRLLALNPNPKLAANAYVNLGNIYNRLGTFEDALIAGKKAVECDPDLKEAQYNLALAELQCVNAPSTIRILENLLDRFPDYPPAQFILSAAYCCAGQKEKGIEGIRRLKNTPMGAQLEMPCLDLAQSLLAAKKVKYALRVLGAAIECDIVSKEILDLFTECIQINDKAQELSEIPPTGLTNRYAIKFENLPQ